LELLCLLHISIVLENSMLPNLPVVVGIAGDDVTVAVGIAALFQRSLVD
jgi:hypothetical protein